MEEREFYDGLADLAIKVGVELRRGQQLFVIADVEHAPLARATMRAGWLAGATDVLCYYREPYDRLFLGLYGTRDEQLQRSHPSQVALLDALETQRSAIVAIEGEEEPDLYAPVDDEKQARLLPREYNRRRVEIMGRQAVAWTLIPFPTAAWATRMFGVPDLDRLREVVARCVRLDEPDPVLAWHNHATELRERAARLTLSNYDGVRFRGSGTDLFVGLVRGAVWKSAAEMETAWGQRYCANLPTEEIATTPDCRRTSGVVTTTLPFVENGAFVRDAHFEFASGRVVACAAAEGEPWLRGLITTDDGAAMLGEVALVPADNRLSAIGKTFFHVLFDENVTSHVALGQSYTEGVPGSERLALEERQRLGMCQSLVHCDFMIGGPDIDVFGVTPDGSEEPLMIAGAWSA